MTSKCSLIVSIVVAAVLLPVNPHAQSISLPDGGSVDIDIDDSGGSISVNSPSAGIDFSISFGGGGGEPGAVAGFGPGGSPGGVAVLGKSRAISIPGLTDTATAGPSGGSEQTSRSLANVGPGNGQTSQGLQGEWVAGVEGPGYSVPGFHAGPVGSYGVDAPPGPSISTTGSYTASDPGGPAQPNDATFAVDAPDTPSGQHGAGAAPNGFNPIGADQATPIGGVGFAGIGPPPGGSGSATPAAVPAGVAPPLSSTTGLSIPAPGGPSLLGQGITTGAPDRAPPPTPVPPAPVVTVFVVNERDTLFDEIAELLGISRDVVVNIYAENADILAGMVARGDRNGLVTTLTDLAAQVVRGTRGPVAASAAPPVGGFKNLAGN